ncbi:MAG TPA: transcription termination/antitermination NusG family protein [Planctomycetaceae bacterium]|nr:transcription termination/antitermination NusG family protein [Planctomycetaceae bacterium]
MAFSEPIPMVWPTDAWDGESLAASDSALWCAIKVNARCEKQVARELTDRNTPYFLCLRNTPKVYQRRRVVSQVPFFSGYVFAAGDEEQLASLWRMRNVAARLMPPSQPEFVHELNSLYRLMMSGAPLTLEEQLRPGDQARIVRGSLKGLTGTVVRNCGGLRLIIGVTWLGQGVSVDVTPDMVERVRSEVIGCG